MKVAKDAWATVLLVAKDAWTTVLLLLLCHRCHEGLFMVNSLDTRMVVVVNFTFRPGIKGVVTGAARDSMVHWVMPPPCTSIAHSRNWPLTAMINHS